MPGSTALVGQQEYSLAKQFLERDDILGVGQFTAIGNFLSALARFETYILPPKRPSLEITASVSSGSFTRDSIVSVVTA